MSDLMINMEEAKSVSRRGAESAEKSEELNRISSLIIRSAIQVHSELGPGLLESVYQSCLTWELRHSGLQVDEEVLLPIFYRGREVAKEGFRIDLLVEDKIVVELKSVERIQPVHVKQVLTYLKLADKRLGLLINFNESLLKTGITRIANKF